MKLGVRIVAAPEVAAGFALAGLAVVEVANDAQAIAAVRDLQQDRGIGVMLIEERIFASLPQALRDRLARQPLPMPVPFPGPAWHKRRGDAEAYIVDLLRQVIGYRVRLK